MDQRLYITHLTNNATESLLNKWLEDKLNVKCSTSLRRGRIQGTQIGFSIIGDYEAERAVSLLNNAYFMGNSIKVQKYIQTEKNRKFGAEGAIAKEREKGPANVCEAAPMVRHSPPVPFSGVVVHITSAAEFYVQVTADVLELKVINSFLDLLYLGTVEPKDSPVEPNVGTICAARYSDDGKYYRALIKSKALDGNVDVQFVDFGNSESVSTESLSALPKDIVDRSFIAKRCSFHRLKILNEENAVDLLRACGENFCIRRHKESRTESNFFEWEVDLEDPSGVSVRQKLIDAGLGEALSPAASPKRPTEESPSNCELLNSATCIISHVDSADRFYLQGALGQSDLAQIYECLLTAATLPEVKVTEATRTNIYAAVFSKDGTWYRCQLRDGPQGKTGPPTVCFIDFGNSETLVDSDLRVLPEPIASIPAQAVLCQLPALRITNPSKVMAELSSLGQHEFPLKMHLQEGSNAGEPTSVDFGVEGKFRSFCSWIIENRWAERVYKHKQKAAAPASPTTAAPASAPPARFCPPPAVTNRHSEAAPNNRKWNGFRSKQSAGRKSVPWSSRSPSTTESTPGDASERPPTTLASELAEAMTMREALVQWRESLCHDGEPLVTRMAFLRTPAKDGDEEPDANVGICQPLFRLRDAVLETRTALSGAMEEVKAAVDASGHEEAGVLEVAQNRDALAALLVDRVSEFQNELNAKEKSIKEHVQEVDALICKMDFLLKQRPVKRLDNENGFDSSEASCEKIWNEYAASDAFSKRFFTTENYCQELEMSRQVLGLLTGASASSDFEDPRHSLASFPARVKALNSAMAAEVEAYALHFLSGSNGDRVGAMLERHVVLAKALQEKLRGLNQDACSMDTWRTDAQKLLDGQQILSNGTTDLIEEIARRRKEARSRLRHLLADLEDEEEAGDGSSEILDALRLSLAEVRCELHEVLEQENDMKNLLTDAIELRPELCLQMKGRLKANLATIDGSSVIASWETSYFDLVPVESEDKCCFWSQFKGDPVLIQKVILSADKLPSLRLRLRRYRELTAASCLAPLLAAFVPPRDSHVLFLLWPALELQPAQLEPTEQLRSCKVLLQALHELWTGGLVCPLPRSLQSVGRLRGGEERLVALPLLHEQCSRPEEALTGCVDMLTKIATSQRKEFPTLANIVTSVIAFEDIPAAVDRIDALLAMLTKPIEVNTENRGLANSEVLVVDGSGDATDADDEKQLEKEPGTEAAEEGMSGSD